MTHEIVFSDQTLAPHRSLRYRPLLSAPELVIMISPMPLVLNIRTAMPPLQNLTMRPKNGTWIRTVRVYGRRGACVHEMAMN